MKESPQSSSDRAPAEVPQSIPPLRVKVGFGRKPDVAVQGFDRCLIPEEGVELAAREAPFLHQPSSEPVEIFISGVNTRSPEQRRVQRIDFGRNGDLQYARQCGSTGFLVQILEDLRNRGFLRDQQKPEIPEAHPNAL